MTEDQKVKKFLECIHECEWSSSPNPAILMAHEKYGLNAAWLEDQDAWFKAVAIAGNPFSNS